MFTCCCAPSVEVPLPKAHIAVPVAPKPVMLQLITAPEVKPQPEIKPQVEESDAESESDAEAESESDAEAEADDSPDTCTDILTGLVAVNVLIFLGLTLYSMKLSIDSNFVPYNPTTSTGITSIEDLD